MSVSRTNKAFKSMKEMLEMNIFQPDPLDRSVINQNNKENFKKFITKIK